jgi:hypothetical protein
MARMTAAFTVSLTLDLPTIEGYAHRARQIGMQVADCADTNGN